MPFWSTVRALFTSGRGLLGGLSEEAAGGDPLPLFGAWFQDAVSGGLILPESMALATATREGKPSVRLVLLKEFDEHGFVFFTNYESRKAEELEANPQAALVFHWPLLQRQVRLEGMAHKISKEESEAYFRTRPRGSQIGAWASKQSLPMASRRTLEERVKEFEGRMKDQDVPLPPFWGGYRLAPESIEFWQGRANRLHDRILYVREGDGWNRVRLYP